MKTTAIPSTRSGCGPNRTACALRPGQTAESTIHVRNFRKTPQTHRIAIHAPPGIVVEPAVLEGKLDAESRGAFPVRIRAAAGNAADGVHLAALDVTLDGRRYGEWFDFVVGVEAEPAD